MVNISIILASSKVTGPGGLFDFNATLPLVLIQFILLMLILNTILYNPLLIVITERQEYILNTLTTASEILAKSNELIIQYEQELENVRKQAQLEIKKSQKTHEKIFEIELNISQKYIDNLLENITNDLLYKKNIALNNLDDIVQFLSNEIETKLFI